MEEGYSTGRAYLHFRQKQTDIHHSESQSTVQTSAWEIELPTKGYDTTVDLYQTDHERGEVALCSLAAIWLTKSHPMKNIKM